MMARAAAMLVLAWIVGACASGQDHDAAAMHAMHPSVTDPRSAVHFPAPLRDHTLANMREHLQVLQQVQASLALGRYDDAAQLAESRLGLTSLPLHGAHDVAPYMPQPMQDMGTAMHKAASRFSVEATNASATGDLRPALAALAHLTAQCVACHAAYRLER